MREVSEVDFKEIVLESDIPVVVDFWADWCAPCKMLTPILNDVAQGFEGKVKFLKINVDENTAVASEYGIMSIPALIIFKAGKPAAQSIGVKSREDLSRFVESNI